MENAGHAKLNLAPTGAIQSLNDYREYGYGGLCPPVNEGIHAYIFTVYAFKVPSLKLTKDANSAMVGFYIHAHTHPTVSLIIYYERKGK